MSRNALILLLALAGCRERAVEAQTADPRNDVAPASCVSRAEEETNLSLDQARALCGNAPTDGPVQCYVAADDELNLSEQQTIALCRDATTPQPVACFTATDHDTNLSAQQILDLCATGARG